MVLDDVTCAGTETTLLSCFDSGHNLVPAVGDCNHNNDISVRCVLKEEQQIKNINISVNIIDVNAPSTVHTALISWVLYNTTMDEPTTFDVKCSNEQHSITMSVSGQNFTTHLMGLLPFTSYNCCVSAVYERYIADSVCDGIEIPHLDYTATQFLRADHNSETEVVGGVLGFIVVILLVLLIISGVALVYLLLKRNALSIR